MNQPCSVVWADFTAYQATETFEDWQYGSQQPQSNDRTTFPSSTWFGTCIDFPSNSRTYFVSVAHCSETDVQTSTCKNSYSEESIATFSMPKSENRACGVLSKRTTRRRVITVLLAGELARKNNKNFLSCALFFLIPLLVRWGLSISPCGQFIRRLLCHSNLVRFTRCCEIAGVWTFRHHSIVIPASFFSARKKVEGVEMWRGGTSPGKNIKKMGIFLIALVVAPARLVAFH